MTPIQQRAWEAVRAATAIFDHAITKETGPGTDAGLGKLQRDFIKATDACRHDFNFWGIRGGVIQTAAVAS